VDSALNQIFKAYDVRGLYPSEIDETLVRRIGNAFARFVGASRIVVGHDMRPSSIPLADAFIEGVTMAGTDVTFIGLASTDMLYFASGALDAPGAMFTASHNPAQYNGIKMCRASAAPIGEDTGLRQIRDTVASETMERGEEPGTVETVNMLDAFADHVASFVSDIRPLRVVADTANGMGGLVVPYVLQRFPIELTVLYPELDGTFPNHPADPLQAENLKDLQRAVIDQQADVGLAFDGDADRVFLVDDQAQPVSGALTTALVARGMLERSSGETVVHNLICSKAVPEVIREHGGTPVRTRVGHSFIKQVMADTNAIFGGEHSGHYYFRDNFRADSGLIAALVVLQEISRSGQKLSEMRVPLERYTQSGEINTKVHDPAAVIEHIAAHYASAQQDRLDGLTCDFGDWWFNLRPSNTEPLLRLNLEAPDRQACDTRTEEVLTLIRSANA
jgi:phosphomannomutase